MPIKIIKKEDQANAMAASGSIIENKPIGFSTDRKSIKPYSNIYYWSHSWTDVGGKVSDHPHKGFYIFTYVLKGSIENKDSEETKINKLYSGDACLIRSGSGLVHREQYAKNTEFFQIWFDPNLRESLAENSSYQFAKSEDIKIKETPGITMEFIIGNDSVFDLDDLGIIITDYKIVPGLQTIKTQENYYYSAYILKGEIELNGVLLRVDDYFISKNEKEIEFFANSHCRIFIVKSPVRPPYKTYLQLKYNA